MCSVTSLVLHTSLVAQGVVCSNDNLHGISCNLKARAWMALWSDNICMAAAVACLACICDAASMLKHLEAGCYEQEADLGGDACSS